MNADGVLVAIVDSGIDRRHPDLDGVIQEYFNAHSATEDDRDYVGYGTHVAGIIAAETNNRIGIAGSPLSIKATQSGVDVAFLRYWRCPLHSLANHSAYGLAG